MTTTKKQWQSHARHYCGKEEGKEGGGKGRVETCVEDLVCGKDLKK